ncbi:phenoloxidase-activating factor 2-like [Drosophila eugracilis]|uniref:phenoloxidase-activating factor 2-like n=1 Tax=Drosophila eugracilis TaxID=29029 RepID=UPI001BDB0930|nr:phenoloxidase-activating factor 2-like [Drosophila eugracilis]
MTNCKSQINFCGGSNQNRCVARHLCRIGLESGTPITDWRVLQGGDSGCVSNEICCPKTEMVNNRKPTNTQSITRQCGHINSQGPILTINNLKDTTQEGELPWMIALLDASNFQYVASGSLISANVVLTSSSVIEIFNENELIVRAGEWDFHSNQEQGRHEDVAVRQIVRHSSFFYETGANNIALVFLARPLVLTDHINLICLPSANRNFIWNRCIVSGWGKKNINDHSYVNILKKIEVPVMDRLTCQEEIQSFYNLPFFLDKSLMCAGGEIGKDSCKGDGGAPLACPLQSDPSRYEQVGIVNFGDGCGKPIPAVYTDVSKMRPWIDFHMKWMKDAEPFDPAVFPMPRHDSTPNIILIEPLLSCNAGRDEAPWNMRLYGRTLSFPLLPAWQTLQGL